MRQPLIINNVQFLINPRSVRVEKSLQYGALDTAVGRVFQNWWLAPEVLTFGGNVFGDRAYNALTSLKAHYEGFEKVSTLVYKGVEYKGFLTSLTVEASADNPRVFTYSVRFQFLQGERFRIEDLSVIEVPDIYNFIADIASGKLETIIKEGATKIVSSMTEGFSKSLLGRIVLGIRSV